MGVFRCHACGSFIDLDYFVEEYHVIGTTEYCTDCIEKMCDDAGCQQIEDCEFLYSGREEDMPENCAIK
jgi:hypothetical protein